MARFERNIVADHAGQKSNEIAGSDEGLELRNHVERCLLFGTSAPERDEAPSGELPVIDVHQPLAIARQKWVTFFERRYLEGLLAETENNVSEAARRADVDRAHFYRLLSKCGLR